MRKASWFRRIPLILHQLDIDAKPVYTRPEVGALFNLGRSQALDLMKIAGAESTNGLDTTVSRDNLRWYVMRCPEAKQFLQEMEDGDRLARKLAQAIETRNLKAIETGFTEWEFAALKLLTKWTDVRNVAFEPGVLRIAFSDQRDLLKTLVLMVTAMCNQPDEFDRLCGEPEQCTQPETLVVGEHARISRDEFNELLRRATPEERDRLASETATVDVEVHPSAMQLSDQIGTLKTTDSTFDLPAPVAENAGSGREENHSGQ